jgi:hypothetical protein
MRISPILARTEISAVRKIGGVTRSLSTMEPEAGREVAPDDSDDERRRRRSAQLPVPTSASDRSSNAVLSALIGLQERR